MRIAVPLAEGRLCMHFGHCEEFALVDVDPQSRQVSGSRTVAPPPHAPGVIPAWLAEQGATLVLAGGMGGRARDILVQNGVEVITGVPAAEPEALVAAYLAGSLVTGENACDH